MKRKKILILGGEGFIGRNLFDFLSKNYDCYSSDRSASVFTGANRKVVKKNPYEQKIKNNYNIIIHLIDNKVDNRFYEKKELELIKNIDLSDKNHLILFSSAVIYANPDSEYGKRKIKMENIYSNYCNKHNIKLTIFRLFNIYGSYHLPNRQGSLVSNILLNYLNGKAVEINDLSACRDFIYAKDLGKFIKYAIEKRQFGIIDLATNNSVSINELLLSIEEAIKGKLNIIDKKNKETITCPKAKNKLIGKIKVTSLKQGLRKTFLFYKKNLNIINKLSK